MPDLPLIFFSGLLGSSHCIGMCGGFALMVGMGSGRMAGNLRRQATYSAGRLMTYSFCGAVAGTIGKKISSSSLELVNLQSLLAIIAGILLMWQGAKSSGLRVGRSRIGAASGAPCLTAGALRTFLTAPDLTSVFLAGLMTGFLPCGLVYAHLALASARAECGAGIATMAVFGAGTIPLMVVAGLGGSLISVTARRRLLSIAAGCVLLTGALSIYRGTYAWTMTHSRSAPVCPFCSEKDPD